MSGVAVRVKHTRYRKPSKLAEECGTRLMEIMVKEDWSWEGKCSGCRRHFAQGLPNGSWWHSRPEALAGNALRSERELVQMMIDFGGISMLVYMEEIGWPHCEVPNVWKPARNRFCPRCRAFDSWANQWRRNLMERLSRMAQRIWSGSTDVESCLDELTPEGRCQAGVGP